MDSGFHAFLDIIDMLLFEVATFLPNLVKFDLKMSELYQFFEIQHGVNKAAAAMLKSGN